MPVIRCARMNQCSAAAEEAARVAWACDVLREGLTTVIRQNRRITKINLQHNYFDILYYSRYIPNTLKRKNIFVKL